MCDTCKWGLETASFAYIRTSKARSTLAHTLAGCLGHPSTLVLSTDLLQSYSMFTSVGPGLGAGLSGSSPEKTKKESRSHSAMGQRKNEKEGERQA